MSLFDGNASEMPEHRPVDDGAIEAALAGHPRGADLDALSSFVSAVRSVVEAVPTPSPAMAAVLTAGLSTVKGDLPATAASNVNGPASQEAGLPKWRKAYMKIQGFIAGLGVAGKVALGVGVAAAATTGAGAAGVLPFSVPGHAHHRNHAVVHSTTTTTTKKSTPNAAFPIATVPHAAHVRKGAGAPHHANTTSTTTTVTSPATVYVPPVTSTTVEKTTPTTPTTDTPPTTDTTPTTETPTTVYEPPSTTSTTTTPTTQPPGGDAPTQSIQLSCTATGATQVTCTWTAAPGGVAKYSLWRWTTGGNGSDYASIYDTPDGLTFVDNNVTPGVPFTYRVFTTLGTGASGPWSNRVYMSAR
jgi:hypothetical protein